MVKIIGIDLGTTNSVVSYFDKGQAKIIENPEGNRTTPSVVSFKNGEIIIGEAAKRQAITNENTIISVKRFMGTDKIFNIENKEYKPEQISALILSYLKEYAEKKLGETVTDAIITVPAYFNDQQRKATKDAGKIAGLNVQRIINEPTAAALAYGIDNNAKDEIVLVYDFGGGTFDISILQLKDGIFEVLSTAGDNHLGGDDIDAEIMTWIVNEFKIETGIDLTNNKMAIQRLKEESEKAKKNLSSVNETTISLPFIINENSNPFHIEKIITKEKFDELTKTLIERTIEPIKQALNDASVSKEEIDQVILVGGTTRIPAVRQLIINELGKEPNVTVNPDEVVALGAAYQSSLITGEITDIVLLDVNPLSLGVETKGGLMTPLIKRNTTIPANRTLTFTTVEDNQKSVEVKIFQGERILSEDNKFLGNLILSGIKPGVAGSAKIFVTFSIDDNGIVKIIVKDQDTGLEKDMILEGKTNLTENDIEKMINDADENRQHDLEIKKSILIANISEKKLIFVKHEIHAAMSRGINSNLLNKYQEFVREYEYAISTKSVEKLTKMNSQVETLIDEVKNITNQDVKNNSILNDKHEDKKVDTNLVNKKEEVKLVTNSIEEENVSEADLGFSLSDEVVITSEISVSNNDQKVVKEENKNHNVEITETVMSDEVISPEINTENKKSEVFSKSTSVAQEKTLTTTKTIKVEEKLTPKVEQKQVIKVEEKLTPKVEQKQVINVEEKSKIENKEKLNIKENKITEEKLNEVEDKTERPIHPSVETFKNAKAKKPSSTRVKNEELEILRQELDSLRLKNLELFEEMEDIKKDEK